jgi:hypothetical protein
VTLKGSSSRAQGAALGMDAEQEISPERAAQAVSPFQGCSQLIAPDPRVSPWAGLHRPSGLTSLTSCRWGLSQAPRVRNPITNTSAGQGLDSREQQENSYQLG